MSWDESWRTLAFSEANDLCNGFSIAALFSGGTTALERRGSSFCI
jgi:hypothetical protein